MAAVGAVVSAVVTILDLRATRRSVRLAEDQAQIRPALEISFALLDVWDVEYVWEPVKHVLEDREKEAEKEREEKEKRATEERERRERERKEKEEQEARERRIKEGKATNIDKALDGMKTPGFDVRPLLPSVDTSKLFGSPMQSVPLLPNPYGRELYEGPLPEKVVVVGIGNRGRIAAYDVTGWIYLNADHLEPLPEFSEGSIIEESEDGFFKVELGFREGTKILPTPNDDREFYVAALIQSTGITTIRYEFQTPQGDIARGEQELELTKPDLPEEA